MWQNNRHNGGSVTIRSFMGKHRPTVGDQKGVGGETEFHGQFLTCAVSGILLT